MFNVNSYRWLKQKILHRISSNRIGDTVMNTYQECRNLAKNNILIDDGKVEQSKIKLFNGTLVSKWLTLIGNKLVLCHLVNYK